MLGIAKVASAPLIAVRLVYMSLIPKSGIAQLHLENYLGEAGYCFPR
jgi:hypothetical protein